MLQYASIYPARDNRFVTSNARKIFIAPSWGGTRCEVDLLWD